MRFHSHVVAMLAWGLLTFTAFPALADEAAVKGRKILADHKFAVVTVQLVLKQQMSMPGRSSRDNEMKTETTGTVISPEGLTVVSLSVTDPSYIYELQGASQMRGMQITTEVRDLKILLDDGTELPGEVILRDKDLDLAFVRPLEKPEKDLAYVDMANSAEVEILDQVIALNRLGQVARRTYSASVERIDAVVTKPRTFYIPGKDATQTGLGSPAFSLDGKIVGVFLIRAVKGTGGGMRDNIANVVLPAEDIAEAASQAPPFKERD